MVLLAGDVLRLNPAQGASLRHHYSLAAWEARNLLSKWTHRLGNFLPWSSRPALEGEVLVDRYFRLGSEVRRLRDEISRAAAGVGPGSGTALMKNEKELSRVMAVRERLRGDVEEVIESTISAVLTELDIASWADLDYPPVDIRLEEPPRVLVTSPRDRIMRSHEALVATNVTVEEREGMEQALVDDDLSALVADIGGVATYPAIVLNTESLRWTLGTAAHEWLHHYLVTHLRPLGLRAFSAPEMRTINETLVDIAGREIGDLAFQKLGGTIEPAVPHRNIADRAEDEDENEFDFNREMRETRSRVDGLLASGAVDEAEAYMEERRNLFVEHGFYIRKLNQAYFAINGTYGERPQSSSPIGGQMREIRALTPGLKTFISTVSQVSSQEGFMRTLERLRAWPPEADN